MLDWVGLVVPGALIRHNVRLPIGNPGCVFRGGGQTISFFTLNHIANVTRVRGILLGLLLVSSLTALAGEADSLQQKYDAAFLEMYEDVGNLDKTFRFAELAVQVGDFEGAVSALERMLIIDPDLPQVRMQLGMLYFQMQSYAMAYAYLNAVREHEDVPAEARQQAEDLIAQIDALTSAHRFSSTVVGGLRYQTNANSGPPTNEILLFGNVAILDDQYTEQADWDGYLTGQFDYVYDFETDPKVTIETGLSLYGNRQDEQSQVDTRLYELQVGPRLAFSPQIGRTLDIRPYLVVNDLTQGGAATFSGLGGGINCSYHDSPSGAWELGVRYVQRDYPGPEQVGLTGPRTRLSMGKTFELSESTMGSLTASAFNENADDDWAAYWEYGVEGSVQYLFGSPLEIIPQPWAGSLVLGLFDKNYAAENLVIAPGIKREDDTLRASASVTVALSAGLALVASVGYTEVDSNLLNYVNDNKFVSLSAMGRF